MTIDVDEWYDSEGKLNLTISWDENDPLESQFNNWTKEDFLTAITNACYEELPLGDEILSGDSQRLHLAREHQEDIS